MRTFGLVVAGLTFLFVDLADAAAGPQVLLYATEGNRLRRIDLDTVGTPALLEDVLVDQAGTGFESRDVNGMICTFPDGSGRFVLGEDTNQPDTRAGWGVFDRLGRQIGKLTASYTSVQPEPYGCAFAANGTLFTVEVGDQGFGTNNGQLILWFPPYDRYPGPLGAYPDTTARSTRFCKLATNIGTAGGVAIDAQGRVYVASSSNLQILRFSPPFPTGSNAAGGCGRVDSTGAPLATVVNRQVFATPSTGQRMFTFSGLAIAPNGNLYAASVLTGRIAEYDLSGALLRFLVDHEAGLFDLPKPFGTPQGIAVGPDGTVYYADLDLQGALPEPGIGPGDDGKVWRVRFDENGDPLPPEVVRAGLAFPDGVAVVPGNLQSTEWPTYGGNPERQFFNHDEHRITKDNVASLVERWRFPTNAIITASPTVADVMLDGEGPVKVVFIQSWDAFVYAIRMSDGSELWRFKTDEQPGASYPSTASVHFDESYGRQQVVVGTGEVMYGLDARTGRERWRFTAGTGCGTRPVGKTPHPPAWFNHRFLNHFPWDDDDSWHPWGWSSRHPGKPPKPPQPPGPPGLCGHQGERNEIESSAIVAGGKVIFGMDVDDSSLGRGGLFAVSAWDGRLAWFFDPESGKTCRPHWFDDIHYFDGYHSAKELGLPAHFFRTRPGCNFDRRPTGCGNIWSSPAYDASRKAIYIASSNCDTDTDPTTNEPPPPMPPYDEALFSLDLRGKPLWRWRPREVDNADLAFGAAPNLFSIQDADGTYEVVGIGNKDGTYYVIGRDGVNERTGAAWDDPDPSDLPYWRRNVVLGGVLGGIPATASVDEVRRRVIFSTAPGGDVNVPPFGIPQTPVFHSLDMDTGDIVWETNGAGAPDASFAPASSIPGVTFFGSVLPGFLRAHRTDDDSGAQLLRRSLAPIIGLASAPVAVDGTLLFGGGIGVRTGDPDDLQEIVSRLPVPLTAWCVAGTDGCPVPVCSDGLDNDGDGRRDFPADTGCVFAGDQSEIKGDLDFDGDIDGGDAVRLNGTLGSLTGDDNFIDAADFDRDGDVDAADEATWYAAYAAAPRSTSHEWDDPATSRARR